ncbi:hypothetical protein [Micromonospora sp. CP22]|uniref:hypothetical protein n=1 Tax=Micromonospora sp. CP22 TaxID=2580517 RepID=UPI0012BB5830|nr:hypothetical protein [Micromonospora sp. CP22]MTK04127.1 hypothetical protein [Micromonospora sp. CP22]
MVTDDGLDQPALDPGNDFEQKCWGLLRRRYPQNELVYLPADMGGDCGIEGFSLDGIAYQCYADRDSQSLRHRTDKQKDKLYTDTAKLKKYADRLKDALGGTVIHSYFLMVPEFHAVELVAYANKRAEAVREFSLPFVSEAFRIFIKTPADYPVELQAAMLDGSAVAVVATPHVDSDDMLSFADEKPELVATLESKLAVMLSSGVNVTTLRDAFVRSFLQKDQIMTSFAQWPETWERLESQRQLYQEGLEFDNEFTVDRPHARLKNLVESYQDGLRSSVSGLSRADAQRIAYGQIGEWLMRCPLKLREAS